MNDKEKLLKLYQTIFQDNGTPSDKNLFEMASLKEFRHSAILGYLLSRKEHGQCIHLKTLLGLIMPQDALVDVENVIVECERMVDCDNSSKRHRPIDILCQWGRGDGRKALIIENKCRGAGDQEGQIEAYWKGVKKLGYEGKNIYVLYLPPMNGSVKPSEFSLGNLDFSGELKGHLMVYSYRELILPWLKTDVLPQICYGHGALLDSLKSYIDLLEGVYGERPLSKDERAQDLDRLMKAISIKDLSDAWEKSSHLLEKIESAMAEDQQHVPEDRREGDIRKFSELQAFLWRVRSLLREQDPLLDRDNLIYEVYWMLKNNPTPFGAKYLRCKLDSGSFFTVGRKGSIWDSCKINDHVVEVVCNSEELFYCLSKTKPEDEMEQKKSVLQFGIGGVELDSADELSKSLTERMKPMLCETKFLKTEKWMIINVSNNVFNDAKKSHGGELLWKTAEVIANVSHKFYETISAIEV